MKISGRFISTHNLFEFEECLNDFQKEVLKLRLIYDYIGRNGFTNEADSVMGFFYGAVSFWIISFIFVCFSRS